MRSVKAFLAIYCLWHSGSYLISLSVHFISVQERVIMWPNSQKRKGFHFTTLFFLCIWPTSWSQYHFELHISKYFIHSVVPLYLAQCLSQQIVKILKIMPNLVNIILHIFSFPFFDLAYCTNTSYKKWHFKIKFAVISDNDFLYQNSWMTFFFYFCVW